MFFPYFKKITISSSSLGTTSTLNKFAYGKSYSILVRSSFSPVGIGYATRHFSSLVRLSLQSRILETVVGIDTFSLCTMVCLLEISMHSYM